LQYWKKNTQQMIGTEWIQFSWLELRYVCLAAWVKQKKSIPTGEKNNLIQSRWISPSRTSIGGCLLIQKTAILCKKKTSDRQLVRCKHRAGKTLRLCLQVCRGNHQKTSLFDDYSTSNIFVSLFTEWGEWKWIQKPDYLKSPESNGNKECPYICSHLFEAGEGWRCIRNLLLYRSGSSIFGVQTDAKVVRVRVRENKHAKKWRGNVHADWPIQIDVIPGLLQGGSDPLVRGNILSYQKVISRHSETGSGLIVATFSPAEGRNYKNWSALYLVW